jgi:hypothetical protein
MRHRTALFLMLILAVGLFFGAAAVYADNAPAMPLKDSIPVAEAALTNAKIDVSGYFLYSITYGSLLGRTYWYFTYKPTSRATEIREIYVKVYENKSTEITGGGERY